MRRKERPRDRAIASGAARQTNKNNHGARGSTAYRKRFYAKGDPHLLRINLSSSGASLSFELEKLAQPARWNWREEGANPLGVKRIWGNHGAHAADEVGGEENATELYWNRFDMP